MILSRGFVFFLVFEWDVLVLGCLFCEMILLVRVWWLFVFDVRLEGDWCEKVKMFEKVQYTEPSILNCRPLS